MISSVTPHQSIPFFQTSGVLSVSSIANHVGCTPTKAPLPNVDLTF